MRYEPHVLDQAAPAIHQVANTHHYLLHTPPPPPTRGDVRHERQVLDQAAGLPLGRVGGAQHAPLAGVQRARAGHLGACVQGIVTRGAQGNRVRRQEPGERWHLRVKCKLFGGRSGGRRALGTSVIRDKGHRTCGTGTGGGRMRAMHWNEVWACDANLGATLESHDEGSQAMVLAHAAFIHPGGLPSRPMPRQLPPTFLVFSNCDVMRVIMPMPAMKDSRDST